VGVDSKTGQQQLGLKQVLSLAFGQKLGFSNMFVAGEMCIRRVGPHGFVLEDEYSSSNTMMRSIGTIMNMIFIYIYIVSNKVKKIIIYDPVKIMTRYDKPPGY
jgi:hypothetical protein